jgi:hypothetical protein
METPIPFLPADMLVDLQSKPASELRVRDVVRTLVSRIAINGNTMVWIGSGLSMGCGYPGWRAAVAELCKECIPGKADIRPSTVASELLEWAQRCKDTEPDKYIRTLERLFAGQPTTMRPAYSSICGCPFKFLVTTNFDTCLANATGFRHGILSYPDLRVFAFPYANTVVYLHGRAKEKQTAHLLFGAKDLDEAYNRSFIPSALSQLLGSFPSIFVGCGLDEAVLRNLFRHLRQIHSHTQTEPQLKTILLPDEADSSKRNEQIKTMDELGIDILRYPIDEDAGNDRYHYLDAIWALVREEIRDNMQPILLQGGGLP